MGIAQRRLALALVSMGCVSCLGSIGDGSSDGGGGAPAACGQATQTVRRLTQTEYDNTVRDLLGDASQPANSFPADSRNLGFDNNLQTLSTPPALVAGYESAAEKLIADAWGRDAAVTPTAWLRVCDVATAGRDCAQQMVARFAKKAWRRPLGADELTALMALVDAARSQGDDLATGTQLALRAVLMSPNFVFRVESDGAEGALSDYALASRLSYFLWSSMPDDALMARADAGTLHQPEVLKAEVQRLLADGKAQALVDSFAGQWLGTRATLEVSPDPTKFPKVTPTLKQAMHDETALFFGELLTKGGSALDLIDANFTYLNEELATYYGIPGVKGATMQRVQLPPGSHRGGLLTQAGFLTATSLTTRTSAVRRGKWVLGQLLCQAPPPPPPNIPALPSAPPPGATQRQILESHANNAACSGCHARMDPIGFALESFDAAGQWRTQDNGAVIDTSGTLEGKSFDGALALEQIIKSSPSLPSCLASTVYSYALGRSTDASDRVALAPIADRLAGSGASLAELFTSIATSPAFSQRCPSGSASDGGAP